MEIININIGLGFLEGVGVVLSPCILPILPIIFAGSVTGKSKRPFGIIIGFVLVFAFFTFFARKLVNVIGLDPSVIRHISFGLLIFLSLTMLSTYLSEKFAGAVQILANIGSTLAPSSSQTGFIGGIFFGGLVAIIWTPCAGPILASVIVQVVIQETNLTSMLTLLAFGLGSALPMALIAVYGRQLLQQFSYVQTHTVLFRKILGLIIILSVCYMIYLEKGGAPSINSTQASADSALTFHGALPELYKAPEIAGITNWINSPPLQITQLQGKVVLVDFWTYSCINCVRTLPYLKSWYDKYHEQGLVIIGVHAPEFDFEKNLDNVKNAVLQDGIKYPVALDNNFVTWRNYHNHYWPAHYLIDKKGYVVAEKSGEGDYSLTENTIRYLLNLKESDDAKVSEYSELLLTIPNITPETYLGFARAQNYAGTEKVIKNKSAGYTLPSKLSPNNWALQGSWIVKNDRIVSNEAKAALEINFNASKVFMVMGNANAKAIEVELFLDDKPAGKIVVDKHSIFNALNFEKPMNGILRVVTASADLEVYTFTFG